MLQIRQIETLGDKISEVYSCRSLTDTQLKMFDESLKMNELRKKAQIDLDSANAENKKIASQINELYKSGERDKADERRNIVHGQKEKIKKLEHDFKKHTDDLKDILLHIPNIPHETVPKGESDEDNEIVKDWTKDLPSLGKNTLAHWDLVQKYDLIDFATATKITGSGFALFKGKGAKLQRALIQFFLDEAIESGYTEYIPPYLVNEASAEGTGQLPDKEGQMYHMADDNLYLIPTAEVPLTNIYRDVIVDKEELPIRLTGHTPCFRREAGSYGTDVKGLNRVHQFDKIEIVQIVEAGQSYQTLDEMVNYIETLLIKLELPYRIVRLCGGDLSFASALTYDFEVYAAAQNKWLEVSSVSNFETFQSNRLKVRYKGEDGKMHLAHTLNGSALALARIYAAILENNQGEEIIRIPSILQPYTRFDHIKIE